MRSATAQNSGPAFLGKLRPPPAGEKVLVAVSGGLDSMVLLHVLKDLSKTRRWPLAVAHFNHGLRGRAGDADEALVRKTAAAMRLPFVSARGDVKKFAKESKLSTEMAARKLRHQFLARAARTRKIKTIALAHHADDQVELAFLRLLRGAGGALAGMKWRSPSPADKTISLLRPLLDVSRSELEQFARENKIPWREDATNQSLDFLRNRIRHELLPRLRKSYQPALNKTIPRIMEIVGAESDFAVETARAWLRGDRHLCPSAETEFETLPVAVQRQVLKLQLAELGREADFDSIASLRASPGRWVALDADISVSRDERGRLSARRQNARDFDHRRRMVKLHRPGRTIFGGATLEWKFSGQPKDALRLARAKRSGREFFDADRMGGQIILRHWRAGDRFWPMGLKSVAKLQDLFVNAKIPRERRRQLVVAESDGEIFWVEGLRISERFKLTPRTKRALVWRWRRGATENEL